MLLRLAKSSCKNSTCPGSFSLSSFAIALAARSLLRDAMYTFAFFLKSQRAVSKPIPVFPPVTIAI